MLGKKVFFLKEFMKLERVKNQVDFEEFLSIYTKEKLSAIINDEIHNARNEERDLSGVHFTLKVKDTNKMVDSKTLKRVIGRLKYEIREYDLIVEWAEGEFILLLPECSIESAQKVSFLLKSITEAKKYDDKALELNYSITYHKEGDSIESFLSRIDARVVA